MGSFDRGFEEALELRPGELIRWTGPGMRRAGRAWVGGRIYVSDQRLFFCPGVLVRRRYGVLRVPLAEIARVDRVSRRLALGAVAEGGLKPHVQITTDDGHTHALTMQRFAKRAAELEAVLPRGASADA
jgi:hypothetical protein